MLIDDLWISAIHDQTAYLARLSENMEIKQYNPVADSVNFGVVKKVATITTKFGKYSHRMHNKMVVVDDQYGITNARNAWSTGPRKKIPVIAFFNSIIEDIFALIPFANLWPFTYSTSYELRDGGVEMPFTDANFHQNYKSVGQFPGARMTPKTIKTRLTKVFLGPLEPII